MELELVGTDKQGRNVYKGVDGKHYIRNPPWSVTQSEEGATTFTDGDTVVVLFIDDDGFASVTKDDALIWSSATGNYTVGLEKAGVPKTAIAQMYGREDNPPAGTNHTITASVDGKAVSFNAKAITLSSEKIDPEETDKDGLPIKTISKIKATGEILGPGDTTREVVNSEGRKVDKSEIVYRLPTADGGYQIVRKFQKTDALKVEDYLPRSALNDFLVEKQLEFIPKAPEDANGMWQLAEYLNRTGQVATSVIVLREGWEQYGLLLVPFVDADKKRFTLIGYLVKKRVEDFTGVEIPAFDSSKPVATEVQTGVKSLFKKNPWMYAVELNLITNARRRSGGRHIEAFYTAEEAETAFSKLKGMVMSFNQHKNPPKKPVLIAKAEQDTIKNERGKTYRTAGYYVDFYEMPDGTFEVGFGDERGDIEGKSFKKNEYEKAKEYYELKIQFDVDEDFWNEEYD